MGKWFRYGRGDVVNRCKYCGVNIQWISRVPYENGVDHREICPGLERVSREKVRDVNHEQRVRRFLADHADNRAAPKPQKPRGGVPRA